MPSFRAPRAQAEHAVSEKVALCQPRHDRKNEGRIHSVRTAQAYTQGLSTFTSFIQENQLGDLKTATAQVAQLYLAERQESGHSQKTLDQDRQSIQCHLGQPLERVKALKKTILSTRSYTIGQIRIIAAHQGKRNALATEIAYAAGLRAHELQTLHPTGERPASTHREWRADRFTGRGGARYTVQGKGGLIREVRIPHDLVARLEAIRFGVPKTIIDRGVHYQKHYDIGGGKNWSTSFSRVSESQLGWSRGGHGLRHSFAQERMSELQRSRIQLQGCACHGRARTRSLRPVNHGGVSTLKWTWRISGICIGILLIYFYLNYKQKDMLVTWVMPGNDNISENAWIYGKASGGKVRDYHQVLEPAQGWNAMDALLPIALVLIVVSFTAGVAGGYLFRDNKYAETFRRSWHV